MNNTKLISLLKTFTSHEFNEFGKFINSPFHNESSLLTSFYEYLKDHYPDFNDTDFTKENIFKKLYGTGRYDDKKVRDRFSDMLTHAESYLAFLDLRKNPFKLKSHTLTQLSDRHLEVHFNKKVKEIQTFFENNKLKDIDYFHDVHQFLRIKTDFSAQHELMGKSLYRYDELTQEVDFFLNLFVTQMVNYYIVMKNNEDHLNYRFEYKFYEQVMKYADENCFDDNLIVKFYSLILKLRNNASDTTSYFNLKQLFVDEGSNVHIIHRVTIGAELYNIATENFLSEKEGFENEQFEILKLLLKHESYSTENGWMTREVYLNGAVVSLINNDLEWAENFMKDYSSRVDPDKRESAQFYVTGLLHYAQKKYASALDSLSKISGKDFYYYIIINALRSRIYFDQTEYEKVLTLVKSFKTFLGSNPSIPDNIKNRYTNYLNALQKLTLLSTSVNIDGYDISKLVEEIKNFPYEAITTNKKWLLEKVFELRKVTGIS